MSNIKLKDHYWETSGVFDKVQNKTQRELNSEISGKVDSSAVGAASGVASLDSSGKVPIGQLPVDSALSRFSTNPVQNKVVKAGVDDLKSAIENVEASLATVETTSTASQAYAVGDLLVYGGRLYKVASVIAAGATLTPGTNIVVTTVENQLTELSTEIEDTSLVGMPHELIYYGYKRFVNGSTIWEQSGNLVRVSGPREGNRRYFDATNAILGDADIQVLENQIVASASGFLVVYGVGASEIFISLRTESTYVNSLEQSGAYPPAIGVHTFPITAGSPYQMTIYRRGGNYPTELTTIGFAFYPQSMFN